VNIHSVYAPILAHFRASRIERLYALHPITPRTRVLDVGGTAFFWMLAAKLGYPLPILTLLNHLPYSGGPSWASLIRADARELPFPDQSFDLAFSNSVIEHLGTFKSQEKMAAEIRRVARAYWVQTPDIRFPIEPHYLAPFVHWVPCRYRARAAQLTPWALMQKPSSAQIRERIAEIRLLGPGELQGMFPGGRVISERFLGLPKSLVATSL
jgi:SAM-dependent methyltransferase